MELSIGFSTCPNDTFIFAAMINGWINTGKYTFNVKLSDVEELNKMVSTAELDISKLSYRAWFDAADQYALLRAGGALGRGCGPLLIAKKLIATEDIPSKTIAIPGKKTTANFLLDFCIPNISKKNEMLFSNIEQTVLEEACDCGLIIHENRFTYTEKGLVKIIDLGSEWESRTGAPIPLGAIALKRSLGSEVAADIERLIKESLQYAYQNREQVMVYVSQFAQEMEDEVMAQHIALYVNEFTTDIGEEGIQAIQIMADHIPDFSLNKHDWFATSAL